VTKKTKGSERLQTLVRPKRVFTLSEIARRLGVTRQTVDAWCSGEAVPRLEHAAALEDLLGIPLRDWNANAE